MAECENEAMVDAPLANTDEWHDFNGFQSSDIDNSNVTTIDEDLEDGSTNATLRHTSAKSLEDLVNTFDETINKCFNNFNENTAEIAPVQIQSQEELLDNCSMWWTITGNYGNMLPIDWNRTHARKLQLEALNLGEPRNESDSDPLDVPSDDEIRAAFDLHSTVSGQIRPVSDDVIDADDVINEITGMMEDPEEEMLDSGVATLNSSMDASTPCIIRSDSSRIQRQRDLEALSTAELHDMLLTLEPEVGSLNEQLVTALANRDELEHRRELQNLFISLLLQLQRGRKQVQSQSPGSKRSAGPAPGTYMTTVIPYNVGNGPVDNQTLQIFIKLLQALNDDSPTVPSLLTDYILKVLCPT